MMNKVKTTYAHESVGLVRQSVKHKRCFTTRVPLTGADIWRWQLRLDEEVCFVCENEKDIKGENICPLLD